MTVIETFSDFVAGLRVKPVPESAVMGAKRSILDWYAATIAGGVLPPATLLRGALSCSGGRARLLPSGEVCEPRSAALINGSAAHTVEVDDIYRDGLYHPGAPVIAAALALAEERDMRGRDFLRAVIAGYEVSNRIAAAVNPAHYRYWHTTATVGFFGSAAAGAAALALDTSRTAHALATCGTFAAGLQQAFRSDAMSKPLHAGRAAEGGVLSALSAEAGLTGALDIIEGPSGFANAMAGPVDWELTTDDLGEHFTIEDMTQKAHACCGHIFAAIDGALELRAEYGLQPDDIERVEVRTYAAALEICGNAVPRSAFEAKFSIPYCLAAALANGHVAPSVFASDNLNDFEQRKLMARVTPILDPEREAAFPKQRSATVVITTRDGQTLERFRPTRKGDPDDPLSNSELSSKFHVLVDPILGEAPAKSLEEMLWNLEDVDRLASLPLGGTPLQAAHG